MAGVDLAFVVTALGLGLRHGLDVDHLASIADLSSGSASRRRGFLLSTSYAVGHGAVVFGLGALAIVFGARLPAGIDAVMSRVVGASLVLFAGYVVFSLIRRGRSARLRSRWSLVRGGAQRIMRRGQPPDPRIVVIEHEHPAELHHGHPREAHEPGARALVRQQTATSHRHVHIGVEPDDPFAAATVWSALLIGMVHGIGAETPTQVIALGTAGGAATASAAGALLLLFVIGIFASNTLVALVAWTGLLRAERAYPVFVVISVVVAVMSGALGLSMLIGAV